MEIEFKNPDLDRLETDIGFDGGFSRDLVKAFRKRIQVIRAAVDERDLYAVRGNHFEKLKGNRSHQYSMRLNDQWRLIIEIKSASPRTSSSSSISRTTTSMSTRTPAEVFPPGEFIRDELEARGWTQGDLAQITGRPESAINLIINDKRGITPETAVELAGAFGTTPEFWLNIENAYKLSKVSVPISEIRQRALLFEASPVKRSRSRGCARRKLRAGVSSGGRERS